MPMERRREICRAVVLPKVRSSKPFSLAFWRVAVYSVRISASESMTFWSIFLRSILSSTRTLERSWEVTYRELLRVPARARSCEDLIC